MMKENIVDRRFFLQLNAATVIGLTLRGSPVFAQASAVSPQMAALSAYMAAAAARPLPAEVMEQARYRLPDPLKNSVSPIHWPIA